MHFVGLQIILYNMIDMINSQGISRIVFLLLLAVFCFDTGILSAKGFSSSTLFSIRRLILEKGYPKISDEHLLYKTCEKSGIAGFCRSWESLFANANTLGEEKIGRSMVEAFGDPYSMLLSPDETKEFTGQLHGKAVGVGITIFPKNGRFIIGGVFSGSPAWNKGVASGDELISVNGVKLEGESFAHLLHLLSGTPGSVVHLVIVRSALRVNLSLTRVDLPFKMVELKQYSDIGVVKINGFGHGTANEVIRGLNTFNSKGIKKCILDLRDNPGGLFTEAMRVTSFFLPQGAVITYKDTREGTKRYIAMEMQIWKDDLAILINGGTASSSELVAAALKDYRRAAILGTISAGKGSVQTLITVGDGWFFDLTTAHYRSPLGKEIRNIGVYPDIVIKGNNVPLGMTRSVNDFFAKNYILLHDEVLGRSLEFMKKIPDLR